MIYIAAGFGVCLVASVLWIRKAKKAPTVKMPKLSSHLKDAVEELNRSFPDGVSEDHIVEKGNVVGRFLDNDIYDTLKLHNGWVFEWVDVARYTASGSLIAPPCNKSLYILINDLIYKLTNNGQNNIPQAV
jgi:hypothetical protein